MNGKLKSRLSLGGRSDDIGDRNMVRRAKRAVSKKIRQWFKRMMAKEGNERGVFATQ